jgi:hypothetical protein
MDEDIIFNESGVWRFRELLNFCEIDTENIAECSKFLVSLDGAEGRQSKPYHMTKASSFIGISSDNLWLQPEGYNPSGSFKGKCFYSRKDGWSKKDCLCINWKYIRISRYVCSK